MLLAATEAAPQGGALIQIAPLLLIGVVFYFLMIRPQQRKQRAQRELVSSLGVGDEVLTIGGIYGTIRAIDDDTDDVILEVAPGSTVRIIRSAIARPVNQDDLDDEIDEDEEDEDDFEDADPGPAD